ncbi:MAG: hypothetical protein NZ942_01995 [Candidatus Aenigmarchaeota archaeon]|nr:hypothetical protein [Candidatus Aenigmarchaeota archaeon]
MKKIIKIGNSYAVLLPKSMVDFYEWNNKVVNVEMNSEKIMITKTDTVIRKEEKIQSIKTKKGWKKL